MLEKITEKLDAIEAANVAKIAEAQAAAVAAVEEAKVSFRGKSRSTRSKNFVC